MSFNLTFARIYKKKENFCKISNNLEKKCNIIEIKNQSDDQSVV